MNRKYILLTAVALVILGAATLLWPVGVTNAPVLETPAAGTDVTGAATGVTQAFGWRHGYGSEENPNPGRVTHFVICVFEPPAQRCAWPGTLPAGDSHQPLHVWTAAASSLQRTRLANASMLSTFRSLSPFVDVPYQYAFTTPPNAIPASSYGGPLAWTVGACNAQSDDRCHYAEPNAIRFIADLNLKAHNLSDSTSGTAYIVSAIARNPGTVPSGPFQAIIRVFQLMLDANNQPRTDINASQFNGNTLIVLADGRRIKRSDLQPQDVVRGIFLVDGIGAEETVDHAGLDPGAELPIAQITRTLATRPALFMMSMKLDPGGGVTETDENDNDRAELSDLVQ